jgi:TPR repeat protein
MLCLVAGIFLISVMASRAEAKCAAFPQVSWWGKLSHAGIKGYVSHKHGGAWAGYLDKWQRQLSLVKGIHGKGQGIKIRSTGQIIKGQQLGAYIANLAQRVEVNQCLAELQQQKGDGKVIATRKIKLAARTATPYGEGLNAYRAENYSAAYEIWLRLAVGGNLKAQNALGHLYRMGLGVKADLGQSRLWYGSSAAYGDPVGQFSLGDINLRSANTKRQIAEAILLIEKAALKNYAAAQYALGKIHQKGELGRVDHQKAYFWATLAVRNKHKKAATLLKHLEQTLSPTDRQTQSARATAWLARLNS